MHWVEIINARMAESSACRELKRLFAEFRTQVDAGMKEQVRLVVYRNGLVENDLSMHLHWTTQQRPTGKSELGLKLAELLRPLALVDHTIWLESARRPGMDLAPAALADQTAHAGHPSPTSHRRIP